MDPELQKSLADLLAYVKQGADFAVAQAPAVAQEIVRFTRIDAWVGIACFGSIAAALVIVSVRLFHVALASDRDEEKLGYGLFGALTGFLTIPVSIDLFTNVSVLIKTCVAPRLVIIEYITTHIK